MKRFAIILVALGSALLLTLAGCGGGGGGGGVANPAFTRAANLTAPVGTVPAFSAAVAVDEGAGTAADPMIVVGAADDGAGNLRAVAWAAVDNGTAVNSTPTALLPAGVYSRANGINNAGTIVVGEMGAPILPAIWRDTTLAGVTLPIGAATSGAAYDINTAGRIVGETFDAQGVSTAVTWVSDNGVVSAGPTALTNPAGAISSSAYAIGNTTGIVEIAGEFTDATGTHAVVWRDNTTASTPIVLPGLPTATPALNGASTALSINASGTIVGEIIDADNFIHAVRWVKGAGTTYTVQDMGLGTANAINAGGRVVGAMVVPAPAISGAGAWAAGGVSPVLMHADLADGQASGISDTGRAVGTKSTGSAYVAMP